MPLFDSIEGDVTAFFVSQGSVFDALVRSFMERLMRAESRVDALATDVATNYESVSQLVRTIGAAMDVQGAATLARLEHIEQLSTSAAAERVNAISDSSSTSAANDRASANHDVEADDGAATGHMNSHELEYYIVTLARQLHVVLELFFQPHAHDIVRNVQSKQAQFATISDVLTQNEAILMQLSALGAQQQQTLASGDDSLDQQTAASDSEVLRPLDEDSDGDGALSDEIRRARDAVDPSPESAGKEADDVFVAPREDVAVADETESRLAEPTPNASRENAVPLAAEEKEAALPNNTDTSKQVDKAADGVVESAFVPRVLPRLEAVSTVGVVAHVHSNDDNHTSADTVHAQHQGHSDTRARTPPHAKVRSTSSSGRASRSPTAALRSRKKSLYDSFRDFHEQQLREDERQRLQEQALLRKVQHLLTVAKRQWRDEAAATMALEWQTNVRALESQQLKLQTEWKCYQEQQCPKDLVQQAQQAQVQQIEFDERLTALSDSVLAAQHAQEQQIARLLERLCEYELEYVQRADFGAMATAWLQTAHDECVFGVNADALAMFKHEMEAFQSQLASQLASQQQSEQKSAATPLLEALLEEVNRVLELLTRVLELLGPDGAGLHGPAGVELMQTLRSFLTSLDDLAQRAEGNHVASAKSAAAVAETLRRMELGTASLLDAFEAQQDRYERAFEQQQLVLAQLQRELSDQRQADEELKRQLAGCPSHEDTMRFIQDLRDQIHASASDSTTRMLETVDGLRVRMGGLPSADVVERLAQSVQRKADRAEMDRLEKLLAAASSGPAAPVGSLMKTPMKCLACDQNLPYAHSGSASSPEHPQHQQHQHTCSHDHGQQQPQYYYTEPVSPPGRDIFASSTAAARRRKQRQRQLQLLGLGGLGDGDAAVGPLPQYNWLDGASRAFVNLDDGRNRIPLRRTVLSDQVVYGPAITPNAFRPRIPGSALGRFDPDPQRSARPKTAVSPDRRASGGEIITRSISSTVVIRPFAEQSQAPEKRTSKH